MPRRGGGEIFEGVCGGGGGGVWPLGVTTLQWRSSSAASLGFELLRLESFCHCHDSAGGGGSLYGVEPETRGGRGGGNGLGKPGRNRRLGGGRPTTVGGGRDGRWVSGDDRRCGHVGGAAALWPAGAVIGAPSAHHSPGTEKGVGYNKEAWQVLLSEFVWVWRLAAPAGALNLGSATAAVCCDSSAETWRRPRVSPPALTRGGCMQQARDSERFRESPTPSLRYRWSRGHAKKHIEAGAPTT